MTVSASDEKDSQQEEKRTIGKEGVKKEIRFGFL